MVQRWFQINNPNPRRLLLCQGTNGNQGMVTREWYLKTVHTGIPVDLPVYQA